MRTKNLHTVVALAVLALCLGPIGIAAFVLGFLHGESPCVLCWAQRIGMILIALTCLFVLRFGPRPRYIGVGILISAHGLYMALRHASLHMARDVGQGFAVEIMGAHTYIWSGVIFGATLAAMGALLLLIRDGEVKGETRPLSGLGTVAMVVFLVSVGANVVQAFAATGPPPFVGQGDPVRFSFNPKHWVWSLDEWRTGAISWRGSWSVEKPDTSVLESDHRQGPLAGLQPLPVKRRTKIGAALNGAITGAAHEPSSDRFVLTTEQHGVYVVDNELGAVQSYVVVDPGFSVDLGQLAGAAFLDERTIMVLSQNKSFCLLEERGLEEKRDDYRYFLETSGDLAELRRSRLATMRARMHYVMSLGYDAESDSIYTVSVPSRRHEDLVVSRFDRRDLQLSEEFLPRLGAGSGLTLRSSERSLDELYITGIAVEGRRLYALSAAYSTLLVIDLESKEVIAAHGIEDLDRPTGLAIRDSEIYLVASDGAVAVVDKLPTTFRSAAEERFLVLEQQIETTLSSREQPGELEQALLEYQAVERDLMALELGPDDPDYAEQQRVLAYCLLRQGNMLRQLGRSDEARLLSEREIEAARASGNEIAVARTLMSYGSTAIAGGDGEGGLVLLEESRALFESGSSFDHRQGLGWYWILQADLANAGLVAAEPADVIAAADKALEILTPIENWPGVARAYGARAHAHEALGKEDEALADRESETHFEERALEDSAAAPVSSSP